jgi:Fe-S cluster assembly protein SufD
MTTTPIYIREQFEKLTHADNPGPLANARKQAFEQFTTLGIPGAKHEEWKYTRLGATINKDYRFGYLPANFSMADFAGLRLPGSLEANELVFINGKFFKPFSSIRSKGIDLVALEDAASSGHGNIVEEYLGHSHRYIKDGINALNMALMDGGAFLHIKKNTEVNEPVYIYNITDARTDNVFAQPRSLIFIEENVHIDFIETFITLGTNESFTNEVTEIIVNANARAGFYKIQNDAKHANLVSTTHIRQVGASFTHGVTISLDGAIVRNNLNIVLEAPNCEANLYGLYFQKGQTHVDNHTLVDNQKPGCLSNEFYKGILDDQATGVFNGKIFVRPDAQKTNAYQSNKNILLSADATVNTKPQLEIFANDVKCSHGCTVGQLNEEGLFYLRSRGIPEKAAKALLLHGFASDMLDEIRLPAIRKYVESLIAQRLEIESND